MSKPDQKVYYDKCYFSIEQLSNKLKDQGLVVSGDYQEEILKQALRYIGYYRLRGYFYFFYEEDEFDEEGNKKFKKNFSIQDVLDIYYFDEKIRLVILKEIQRVEIAIRIRISEHMSNKYSLHWYMNLTALNPEYNYKDLFDKISQSKSKACEHYNKKYYSPKYPPSFMVTEVLTFGVWSRIFTNLKPEDKQEISDGWGIRRRDTLRSWLHSLTYLRNACSHHNQIWNKSSRSFIPAKYDNIDDWKDINVSMPYSRMSVLQHMAKKINIGSKKSSFKEDIKEAFESAPKFFDAKSQLGFPDDWENRSVWNNEELP